MAEDHPDGDRAIERLNQAAARNWAVVGPFVHDWKGFASGEVRRLGGHPPQDPGRVFQDQRRLVFLSGPSPYDLGSWRTLGPPAASGPDAISLVEWLADGADRKACADFLRDLVDRLVVARAAA